MLQHENVIEQTLFVITSACGFIGGDAWVVFESSEALTVSDYGTRVLLTTFKQCRGVNNCFALCLEPPCCPSIFMLRENSLLVGLASFWI